MAGLLLMCTVDDLAVWSVIAGQAPTRHSVQRVDNRILLDVLYIKIYRHCELPKSTVIMSITSTYTFSKRFIPPSPTMS